MYIYIYIYIYIYFRCLYRRSSAIILLVFHSRPVLDHWAILCVCVGGGGLPNVHFRWCRLQIRSHAGANQTTGTDALTTSATWSATSTPKPVVNRPPTGSYVEFFNILTNIIDENDLT